MIVPVFSVSMTQIYDIKIGQSAACHPPTVSTVFRTPAPAAGHPHRTFPAAGRAQKAACAAHDGLLLLVETGWPRQPRTRYPASQSPFPPDRSGFSPGAVQNH